MPKTETQTTKVQNVRKGDLVNWNHAWNQINSTTTKTKFVYLETIIQGVTLRIEHDTDVEIKREVPTAAENYSDMKARVVDEIHDEVRRAKVARDKARAKLVEHIEQDYRIDYFELGSLAEADAKWEIFVHLQRAMDEAADDDRLIELARHLIEEQRDKLLNNSYRGASTSVMSNALDEHRRNVASELAGRHGFGLATYLLMLDHAAAERDAEAATS